MSAMRPARVSRSKIPPKFGPAALECSEAVAELDELVGWDGGGHGWSSVAELREEDNGVVPVSDTSQSNNSV
jgi:hypothetical protein